MSILETFNLDYVPIWLNLPKSKNDKFEPILKQLIFKSKSLWDFHLLLRKNDVLDKFQIQTSFVRQQKENTHV